MNKSVKIFVWGRFISILGSMIQWVALPLYILDKTGSPGAMGLLFAITAIPRLIVSPFAGAIADRWNRKKIMIATDFINGFLTLIMFFYLTNFDFKLIYLIVIRCFIDVTSTVFMTSTEALLPEICTLQDRTRVNSLNGALSAFANLIGPILGGIIYSIWGLGAVVMINVLSFFITGFLEMLIEYNVEEKIKENINLALIKNDMKFAYDYIRKDKALFSILIFIAIMTFLTQGIIIVVKPYLLRELLNFGSKNYGFIAATSVLGMMTGSLFLKNKENKESKKMFFKGIYIKVAVSFIIAVLSYPILLLFFRESFIIKNLVFSIVLFFWGLANSFIMISFQVAYQERVERKYYGRVRSLDGMITQSMSPLGLLLASFLVENYSVFVYLLLSTIVFFITFLVTKSSYREFFLSEEPKKNELEKLPINF